LAVNLFPLVKYATGIPACVFPQTGYPLSLYYAPVAVFLSGLTLPLGLWVGARIKAFQDGVEEASLGKKLGYLASPAALLVSLAIIVLIRLS
jgi:hypothetical protein